MHKEHKAKAAAIMGTELAGLPQYSSQSFKFPDMFSIVITHFVKHVEVGVATKQGLTKAQTSVIGVAIEAIRNATKLVAYGEDFLVGIAMISDQIDCQQALEDGCRYEFNAANIRSVVHNEMCLNILIVSIEVVDIVIEWMRGKNEDVAKRRLSDISMVMAQCYSLLNFSRFLGHYISHGTIIRIMPLIRFQKIGIESLDGVAEEKDYAKTQHSVNECILQDARNLYMLHYNTWMDPLRKRLKKIYMEKTAIHESKIAELN